MYLKVYKKDEVIFLELDLEQKQQSIYLKFLALIIIIGLFITAIYYMAQFGDIAGIMLLLPGLLLIYPAFMLIYIYLYSTVTNLTINHTAIDNYHFESNLQLY